MSELISVIIPVYNHSRELRKSFNSLLKQTYRPLEVVIVDDGSTDNLAEVLEQIKILATESKEFSLKFIRQANRGAAAARNTGLVQASGEYLIFWDADTVAEPAMLEKLLLNLQQHPGAAYAYCDYRFGWKKMKSRDFDAELLKINNYIDTTALIRRLPGLKFDESLKRFQDWDLWLTLLEQNKTGSYLPELLYKKIVGWRSGISSWRPAFFYRWLPFLPGVRSYRQAQNLVRQKHHLP